MKVTAIVPAAGLGVRLKSNIAKPLVKINDEAIILQTLRKLSGHPLINDIIVVFNSQDIPELKDLIRQKQIRKIKEVVAGGTFRKDSVKNGLKNVSGDTDFVLIHDGVRPFIEKKIISDVIEAAFKDGAAIVGIPLKSTIKKIKTKVLEVDSTLNRNEVWEIQTPQVFKKDLIMRAYDATDVTDVPDDAFLVERLGQRIVLVEGSPLNIKITTPDDIILAKAINSLSKE
ncbi:MAG: 2-C-methyl-D-erythritol 4-phosphate cytidylyltransferase [Candidatus Omnitrophica bacterium]|nr:2-C-methyl-D-erythritol 4-phosphate cytidylyltransferase [Candidatus Omnitrophota bacterium]MDD5351934.1 2-C-methyl-D-erythritol 4-phosphate cytidylyltransferase [Candidatus Omnitrophota bacterium]MDD5550760.1 2-C-methyl-D-erythritol 4-phosphate cytidylyltransferase [Candidatus Omnitrophota bacterium]